MSAAPGGTGRDAGSPASDADSPASDASTAARHVRAVARREVVTLVRTPAAALLVGVLGVVVAALSFFGGGSAGGYLPVVVDLSTPAELLVPLLAFAFGYRVFLDDRRRGELAVHAIMPPSRAAVVLGVFLGRGVALAVGLAVAFAPGFLAAALAGDPGASLYATQRGADSPVVYLRFLSLSTLYGLSTLSLALAVSAAARSARAAVAGVLGLGLAVFVGVDLGLFGSVLAGVVGADSLDLLTAVAPNGAFRRLVLSAAIDVATASDGGVVPLVAGVGSLVAWTLAGLVVAGATVWD